MANQIKTVLLRGVLSALLIGSAAPWLHSTVE